jgi:hypothetical protein
MERNLSVANSVRSTVGAYIFLQAYGGVSMTKAKAHVALASYLGAHYPDRGARNRNKRIDRGWRRAICILTLGFIAPQAITTICGRIRVSFQY